MLSDLTWGVCCAQYSSCFKLMWCWFGGMCRVSLWVNLFLWALSCCCRLPLLWSIRWPSLPRTKVSKTLLKCINMCIYIYIYIYISVIECENILSSLFYFFAGSKMSRIDPAFSRIDRNRSGFYIWRIEVTYDYEIILLCMVLTLRLIIFLKK